MRCYDRQTTQLLFLDARVCSLHIFTYTPKYLVLNSEDPFPSENGFYKVILDPIIRVGSQIREIIDKRDAYETFLLNESQCQHLVTFLCTAD